MATVNVLIPTYNPKPEHLKEALDSLFAQSYQDFDVLVQDDCSDTDVESMVREYTSDSRVRVMKNKERLGIGNNWNEALLTTTGDYVQYLFQDDIWEKEYLQSAMNALQANERAGSCVAFHEYALEGTQEFIDSKREYYDSLTSYRRDFMREGLTNGKDFLQNWLERGFHPNVIGEPSFVMLRRSLTDSVGIFNSEMVQGLDMEYWIRSLMESDFVYLSQKLGTFRVHGTAATAVHEEAGEGLTDRLLCLHAVAKGAPSKDMRDRAKRIMKDQLKMMARKFFARSSQGRKTSGSSLRPLMKFALAHPFLTLQGILGAMHH